MAAAEAAAVGRGTMWASESLPCHADGVVSPRGGARVDHKKKERERQMWQEKGDAGTGHPFVVLPQPTPPKPSHTHDLKITQLARSFYICDANDCRLKPIRVLPPPSRAEIH